MNEEVLAKTLLLNKIDNVAIALSALEAGEDIAATAIPRSHKVATVDIAAGAHVATLRPNQSAEQSVSFPLARTCTTTT